MTDPFGISRSAVTRMRELVDEIVRQERRGLGLLAGEVEILDAIRDVLEAITIDRILVEVLTLRSHAADVEREPRTDLVATRGNVLAGDDRLHHVDRELAKRFSASGRGESGLERAAVDALEMPR